MNQDDITKLFSMEEKADKAPYGDFQVQGGKVLFSRIGPMNAQIQKNNERAPEGRGVWAFPWPIFEHFYVSGSMSTPTTMAPKDTVDTEGETRTVPLEPQDAHILKKTMMGLKRYVDKLKAQDPDPKMLDVKWAREDRESDANDIAKALETGKVDVDLLWKYIKRKKVPSVKRRTFWWDGPVYAHFGPKGAPEESFHGEWYKFDNAMDYIKEARKHLIATQRYTYDKKEVVSTSHVRGIKSSKGTGNLSSDHMEVFIPM